MLRRFELGGADTVSRAGAGTPAAVPPRPAATVMLLRPGGSRGVDVFVFRRVATMAFAAGAYVFPGGRVDPQDGDADLPWSGRDPAELAPALSATPELARSLLACAVRETFEECGVLLAVPPGGGPVEGLTPGRWSEHWTRQHEALLAGRVSLAGLLRAAGLVLRPELLLPWAHWVTPPEEPRRYDTRFFVAALPPGQDARDLGGEGELAQWLPAAEGVRRYAAGQVHLLPPTVVCMEELAAAGDVDAVLGAQRRIRPVMPWPVPAGPGRRPAVEVDLDGLGGGEPR